MQRPSRLYVLALVTTAGLLPEAALAQVAEPSSTPEVPSEATEGAAEASEEGSESTSESTDDDASTPDPDLRIDDVIVSAEAEAAFREGGSVHSIGEEELTALGYTDPNAVLSRVPGVYVRSEEGFGLRPNIGLRGASAERSRKITLLEDGILLAPAPYAAPAAYYFPLMARMTGVEVTAGPAAIAYGPNTVGGAIDLQGRRIPGRREGAVDLSFGNTWFGRAHLHYGDSNRWGGFLVEMMHLRSSGFHELDAPPGANTDTGFHRTDFLVRGELHGSVDRDWDHRLELTLGLGLEQSNETYLGTTDADFRANPYRRYAATQLDRMEWWRTRAQLRYEIESDDVLLRVTAYRHDFDRTWYRLDRFCESLNLRPSGEPDTCSSTLGFDRVLGNPTAYERQYQRLVGMAGAEPGAPPLLVARNHRVFAAQGIQADGIANATTGEFVHRVRFGARVHYDDVSRTHTGDTYQLIQEQMVLQTPGLELERNIDSAWAVAMYASWAATFRHLTVAPGVRTELIWMRHLDLYSGTEVTGQQVAILPGVGVQYEVTPDFALFGGAHIGFSPVAPGSAAGVLPEYARNYELGARYGRQTDRTHGQLTYFASDYDNLSSVCTLASGCAPEALDQQFNAGHVLVMGLEAEAAHEFRVDEVRLPISFSYTWTWSRFTAPFRSENPQFGDVRPGDQLPYVPNHQLSARAGLRYRALEITANGLYSDRMRDVAGQGAIDPEEGTDAFFMLDAMASLEVLPGVRVFLRGENLTDARPLVTRRAWGARGTKPVLVQGGLQIDIR